MNHDTVHCSDYRKSYCPRSCYYAKLTEDLRQAKKRRQLLGVPMSFDSFKDTDVCPRKGKRSAETEEIVNSSSIKMIDEIVGELKFGSSTEVNLCAMYGALCRIRGTIDMADCMKEVLNHERTSGAQEAV